MLKRSEHVGGCTSDYGVSISDIKHACDLDYQTVHGHLNILDKHGVLMEGGSYDFNGQAGVAFRAMPSGWPIAQDIKEFSDKNSVTLSELLVDLRFNLLD